jgi:hypothetical protein
MTTNEIKQINYNTFNETQRKTLIALSKVGDGNTYMKDNKPLEDYIQTLRDMYPEKFHRTRTDLESRVFFDTPTSMATPYARSVRPRSESPYLMKDAK